MHSKLELVMMFERYFMLTKFIFCLIKPIADSFSLHFSKKDDNLMTFQTNSSFIGFVYYL